MVFNKTKRWFVFRFHISGISVRIQGYNYLTESLEMFDFLFKSTGYKT
jgi:hypothetical protein